MTCASANPIVNAIFFGLKRAFHGCLRTTRPWLERLGLTAARFDMLTAVWRRPYGILQSDLRGMLGVSGPTVSRMLRSLENIGLVKRRRCVVDRRQLQVHLTSAGLRQIRRATSAFVGSGAAQLAVDVALVGNRFYDESYCMTEMANAEWTLDRLRGAFRDPARLHYPWHPDD
jgi:DNA-binding MarR family transcriptional regulator